jgi:DNA mismatch repair protein MSH4
MSTGEAVLSQLCDSQTYVRTVHKMSVFDPSQILVMNTALRPKSKLVAITEESLPRADLVGLDRKYWAENAGLEYIQQLAFLEDIEAIKVAVGGSYFAICCLAAVGGIFSPELLLYFF